VGLLLKFGAHRAACLLGEQLDHTLAPGDADAYERKHMWGVTCFAHGRILGVRGCVPSGRAAVVAGWRWDAPSCG